MTHTRCWRAWHRSLAVTALAVALAGLAGCMMQPASPTAGEVRQSGAPVVSAAPDDPCVAFGCEM